MKIRIKSKPRSSLTEADPEATRENKAVEGKQNLEKRTRENYQRYQSENKKR